MTAPSSPGRLSLVVDLLHEPIRWFGAEVSATFDVRPALRVAVLADDEDDAARAAAILAEVAPGRRAGPAHVVPRSGPRHSSGTTPPPTHGATSFVATRRVAGFAASAASCAAPPGPSATRSRCASAAAGISSTRQGRAFSTASGVRTRCWSSETTRSAGDAASARRSSAPAGGTRAARALGLHVLVVSRSAKGAGVAGRLPALGSETVPAGPGGLDEALVAAVGRLVHRRS